MLLFPCLGEQSVLYLFVRYKFQWTETTYGYYAAFQLLGIFLGKFIQRPRPYGLVKMTISCLTQSAFSNTSSSRYSIFFNTVKLPCSDFVLRLFY